MREAISPSRVFAKGFCLTLEKGHDRIDGGATFSVEALAAALLVHADVLCDLPEPCGQGLEAPLLFVRGRHWVEAPGSGKGCHDRGINLVGLFHQAPSGLWLQHSA